VLKSRKSLIVVLWQGKLVLRQDEAVYKLGAEGVNAMVIFRCERLLIFNSSSSTLFVEVSSVTQRVCRVIVA
jgi:hypothetical protein